MSSTTESPTATRKVVIHLRATGDASILKQAKFMRDGADKFAKVIDFLRRQLHRDTLFVYVNSAFSPNPDEMVMDLYYSLVLMVNWWSTMHALWRGANVRCGVPRHISDITTEY